MYGAYLFGIPYDEAREAIYLHQKYKKMPTYIEMMKQLKREHLESELERLQKELDDIL
jgi:predicted mannosyl-3-phosphoglycerate phosphatase (HAD superfamily)